MSLAEAVLEIPGAAQRAEQVSACHLVKAASAPRLPRKSGSQWVPWNSSPPLLVGRGAALWRRSTSCDASVEGMKNEQSKYTVEQRDGEQVRDNVRLWPGRRVVITYVHIT